MQTLAGAVRSSQAEVALPMYAANLALIRRHWSCLEDVILAAQSNLSACLQSVGRDDEALGLNREIYASCVAMLGVSHDYTIATGYRLARSLCKLGLVEETKIFLRDQLLPVARRSLGSDHGLTLALNQTLARALITTPERTRNDLRLNLTTYSGSVSPKRG